MEPLNGAFDEARDCVHSALPVTDADIRRIRDRVMNVLPNAGKKERRARVLRWTAGSAVAVAALAFAITSTVPSPSSTKTSQQASSGLVDPLEIGQKKDLVTHVNESVTDQGITVTIRNVYAEAEAFQLSFTTTGGTGEMPLKTQDVHLFMDGFEIPQELFSATPYASNAKPQVRMISAFLTGTAITLPESCKLTVKIDRIGDVAGAWDFELPVSTKKAEAATHNYNFDAVSTRKASVEGSDKTYMTELKLPYLTMTPMMTHMSFELTQPPDVPKQLSIDSAGLYIRAYAETGEELTGLGLVRSHDEPTLGNMQRSVIDYYFRTPEKLPKTLYLIPQKTGGGYIEPYVHDLSHEKLPFAIENGEDTITITSIENVGDHTRLHYRIDGTHEPYDQFRDRDAVFLQTSQDHALNSLTPIQQEPGDDHAFFLDYARIDPGTPLFVSVKRRPDFIPGLQLAVPIPQ